MRFARLAISSLLVLAFAASAMVVDGCDASSPSSSDRQSSGGRGASPKTPTAPVGASAQRCAGAVAGVEGLRVSNVDCAVGRRIAASWANVRRCSTPAGAPRFSCPVAGYRCLGAATDRGIAVTCARPRRSISFVAGRG